MLEVNNNNEEILMTPEEIEIREKIKSGEDIEITVAVRIIELIKQNLSFEEISKITGRPISDVEKIQNILNR
ncbi:MAG: hypothetical protein IJ509_02675 [Bacilli bacterium]|nr:hypothetical protein [Bacilli bacterium]